MPLPREEIGTIHHRDQTKCRAANNFRRQGVHRRDVMDMHSILGLPNEKLTRSTAKAVGIELTGKWKPCEGCSMADTRRNAMPKINDNRAAVKLGRSFRGSAGGQ